MKFIVIGEVCLDVFVSCTVDRLCPEAPCAVLNPVGTRENYGMAGNVRANLKSLSNHFVEVFSISPIDTIIKTRYVDKNSGYIMMRVDEYDRAPRINIGEDLDVAFSEQGISGIIISDYHKGFLLESDIQFISEWAYLRDIPVFLDTKKILGPWSKIVTFVKINEKEYKQQINWNPSCCVNLIVTRGPKGSEWIGHDCVIPVDPIEVSDVSGAGDTYLAAFALEYCSLRENNDNFMRVSRSMLFANKAARIAVSKRGVVAVKKEEVL